MLYESCNSPISFSVHTVALCRDSFAMLTICQCEQQKPCTWWPAIVRVALPRTIIWGHFPTWWGDIWGTFACVYWTFILDRLQHVTYKHDPGRPCPIRWCVVRVRSSEPNCPPLAAAQRPGNTSIHLWIVSNANCGVMRMWCSYYRRTRQDSTVL